ncbi:jg11404 [Pararge aegeria aegeria]|uniref:Jg11404 protein n=1 Tax=Pararge aegeria aegeria TaxID=348720 RepID=A0A8S4RHH9_9NEOP|nr:jg11404 [Pararge aegeria aegeria]
MAPKHGRVSMGFKRRLRVTQYYVIRNVEIRRRTRVTETRVSSTSREAKVAMSGAHISEKGWILGSQSAGMAAPHW